MNINRLDPECSVHTGSRGYLFQIIPNSVPNQKINKCKLVMKLHWDINNKDFNGKVDIVEEDLEEIVPKSDFIQIFFKCVNFFNLFIKIFVNYV